MQFSLPDHVKYIINALEDAGFEAWCVGGCVRDILLGITPGDFDITTSATPEQIKSIFDNTVDTGLKHGTVTVVIEHTPFEVTTYRKDGEYKDHRSPETIEFVTDIKADLSRRDFTVNALAYHYERGILDIFGGINDLKNKTLRAVGDPSLRFVEDALRILRLFRFSSALNFAIEENTFDSALKNAHLLSDISRERIATEFFKILCSNTPSNANSLFESGSLSFLGISNANFKGVEKLENRRGLRFAYFCKSNNIDATTLCNNLKTDNMLKKYCKNVFDALSRSNEDIYDIKKSMRDYGVTETKDALILSNKSAESVDYIINTKQPFAISHLKINGDDLIKLGFSGNAIGETLTLLTDAVIFDPTLNNKDALLNLIKNT